MDKEEFDSKYVNGRKVVLCNTKEKARSFTELAHSFGYRWSDRESYLDDKWHRFKEATCYRVFDGTFCSYAYYFEAKYDIIIYEEDELRPLTFFFTVTFKKAKHTSKHESCMVEVADIAVRAVSVEEAKAIGMEYAKLSNLAWDYMKVKEYSNVHTKESVADPNFFKIDVRLKDGNSITFDRRCEFRKFCDDNDIYYDFRNGIMLKDNLIFGVFSDICKKIQKPYLNLLNQ